MGPLVREADAARVESWVNEAVEGGARVVAGGTREGAIMTPTILADVDPDMRVSREEVFGPTVAITPAADIDEAIELANDTRLRTSRSDLHSGRRPRHALRVGGRFRQPQHQLRYPIPGRHDALRRIEGQRVWERGPAVRD